MKRRILSLLLAMCLIVGLLPMTALAEDVHTHTPGETPKVLDQVNAVMNSTATVDGKYVVEYTCTTCGETYTEDVPFSPALLHYLVSTAEGANYASNNFNTWGSTGNAGTNYMPTVLLNPGDDPVYFVTTNSHPTYINNTYVSKLVDEAEIAAGNWNMKLEYPVLGTPTLTLKGAKIINNAGLWFGRAAYISNADYKIVIEEDSEISQSAEYAAANDVQGAGAMWFNGTGTVTITGPGKLTIKSNRYLNGIIQGDNKDFIFDGANIDITKNDTELASRSCDAIYTKNGNITVKDSQIKIFNYCFWGDKNVAGWQESYRGLSYGLYAGKDITITDSVVNVTASLSGSGGSSAGIRAKGKLTINNSDVLASHGGYAYGRAFMCGELELNYTNGFTAYTSGSKFSYNKTTGALTYPTAKAADTYTNAADLTSDIWQKYYVSFVHNHIAGDATLEKPNGTCATKQDSVVRCTICDEELSRTSTDLEGQPEKVHTLGKKVELVDQRKAANITLSTGASVEGKYVFECTCAICGETWLEEETFKPAVLHWLDATADTGTTSFKDIGTWNGNNKGNSYKPKLILSAGQTVYFVTENSNATFTDNYYMRKLDPAVEADAAIIEAGNWNIKFDYPLYKDPVLTMKNAKIINNIGLWYGIYAYTDIAPLTIVVESDSEMRQINSIPGGIIHCRAKGGVTITGPGKLSLTSRTYTVGAIHNHMGNLTLDHANIDLVRPDPQGSSSLGHAISAYGGDLTITGGKVKIFNYCPATVTLADGTTKKVETYRGFRYALLATKSSAGAYGNLTIEKGADVEIAVELAGNIGSSNSNYHVVTKDSDGVYGEGIVKFSESTVLISHGGYAYGDAMSYGDDLVLEYANGFTARSTDTKFTYNAETGTITYPITAGVTTSTREGFTETFMQRYFVMIVPKAPVAKFEGTAVTVEDDLTLEFAILAENVPAGSIAYITRGENTTQITLTDAYKEGAYYVIPCTGIAAKEMHDLITVVIKDADGKIVSETKSDSVYDYALRMLRNEKNADDEKLLTVLVDMLNYGTMAQVQFDHNTNNLANAVLTPVEFGFASAEMLETPAAAAKVEGAAATKHYGTTFELNTNISMLIAVNTADVGAGSTAKVFVGGFYAATVNASDCDGYAIYAFNDMYAADGRKDVRFEIYNAAGELKLTVTDSLAAYVGRNIETYPYLENLMKYCDSAAAYFETAI